MGRIVVGADGSDHSAHALRWAADQARVHGHELLVVTAYAAGDGHPLTGRRPLR